ncbi:thermonuclease family protein [Achromobacter spanius]|uniref:thermonuclease family protein n=1 Tax=Achromobacter spanius TaxID=217203 RepID=UPI0022267AE0|nr:thermonuclease family protein [Achromobacter spanius]
MRGKPPFRGGGKLTALIVALILAAAGAIVNWLQPSGRGDSSPASRQPQSQSTPAQPSAPSSRPGAAPSGGIPAGSYTLTGAIVNVADGDTVTLRASGGQRRIRMDSIDAPEEGHGADQPGQPYAEASRKHLADLVAGKTLTAQCYEQDQYGRDVCALILEDGRSANRLQVEAGYAWAYTARKGAYLRDKALPGLQRQAKDAKRGLWAQPAAMQPWKWRYDCWRQRQCG